MELAIGEVARARIQDLARRAVAFALFSMTVKAGAFAFVQGLTLGNAFRGRSYRIFHRLGI